MEPEIEFEFKRGRGTTLLIACGALAREIVDLIEVNRWTHLDVSCLPAKLHHTPNLIPGAIQAKIREMRGRYQKIYVLYGDCGTGGLLDRVLQDEGDIERIAGPHCFSFFMGNDGFEAQNEQDLGTFYLTDYFCRRFDKFVWEALGLDRREDMAAFVFANYTTLLFMPQTRDAALEVKAQEIAHRLKLKYAYRFCGYGELETSLKSVQA
jgi:hypothetical protein